MQLYLVEYNQGYSSCKDNFLYEYNLCNHLKEIEVKQQKEINTIKKWVRFNIRKLKLM